MAIVLKTGKLSSVLQEVREDRVSMQQPVQLGVN